MSVPTVVALNPVAKVADAFGATLDERFGRDPCEINPLGPGLPKSGTIDSLPFGQMVTAVDRYHTTACHLLTLARQCFARLTQ